MWKLQMSSSPAVRSLDWKYYILLTTVAKSSLNSNFYRKWNNLFLPFILWPTLSDTIMRRRITLHQLIIYIISQPFSNRLRNKWNALFQHVPLEPEWLTGQCLRKSQTGKHIINHCAVPYFALRNKWTFDITMKQHRIGLSSWKASHDHWPAAVWNYFFVNRPS